MPDITDRDHYQHQVIVWVATQFPESPSSLLEHVMNKLGPWCVDGRVTSINLPCGPDWRGENNES